MQQLLHLTQSLIRIGCLAFLAFALALPAPGQIENGQTKDGQTGAAAPSERDKLKAAWQGELGQGHRDAAIAVAEQLVEVERKIIQSLPEDQDPVRLEHRKELIAVLQWLLEARGKDPTVEQATALRQELIREQDLVRQQVGMHQLSQLDDQQRSDLERAQQLADDGRARFDSQDFDAALKAFQECTDLREELLGVDHPLARDSGAWIPYLHELLGNYRSAQQAYERELVINRARLGMHPHVAQNTHDLAVCCQELSEFEHTRELYEQELDMRIEIMGPEHRDRFLAKAHNNLGVTLLWTGEYARAKQQLEGSRRLIEELQLGGLAQAASLQNLALLYTMIGDHQSAEPLYKQALELSAGDPSSQAQILDNLGLMHKALDHFEEAEHCFQRALEAYISIAPDQLAAIVPDEEHPSDAADKEFSTALVAAKSTHYGTLRSIARTLNNYAGVLASQSDFEIAERIYQRSLSINRGLDGSDQLASAACLDNLGLCLEGMCRPTEVEEHYRQALDIRVRKLGDSHIETAVSLNNLGLLEMQNGNEAEARDLLRRCLSIRRRLLDETAAVQNERQQLLMNQSLRRTLDDWLSVVTDETAYDEVLRWKGTVFSRQAVLRTLRRRPDLEQIVLQLREVSRKFASISLQVPQDVAAHERETKRLGNEREKLESQLAENCAAYRASRQQAALTPAGLQEILAKSGKLVLVDFLEYQRIVPSLSEGKPPGRERSFVAFVIGPEGPIQRFELGSADVIDELIDGYRIMLQDPRRTNTPLTQTAKELRRRIWQPFAAALEEADVILLSPDGSLGKLPFAALPGDEPESYLLEQYALAVIPVPQAIPSLLDYGEVPDVANKLLVVGGVNYDGEKTEEAEPQEETRDLFSRRGGVARGPGLPLRGGSRSRLDYWKPLDGSGLELTSIRDTYQEQLSGGGLSILTASDATEQAVRELAPQHRFIHLATHGFFAPESLVSALESRAPDNRGGGSGSTNGFIGFDPGLLSGIVLAGANAPDPTGDDGVLTALEVADMDLAGVYLAVLSACETGLGRVAGGEGLLGLQRSFQVAGARTVVASMWEVDDEKTLTLMARFYEKLFDKKGKLSALQALRQAQLEMLNRQVERGNRLRPQEKEAGNPRSPPYEWAAFVLSGDWRY